MPVPPLPDLPFVLLSKQPFLLDFLYSSVIITIIVRKIRKHAQFELNQPYVNKGENRDGEL